MTTIITSTEKLISIAPRQCEVGMEPASGERCTNTAYWHFTGGAVPSALCYDCMRAMADMNSDNEEAFAPALRFLELANNRATRYEIASLDFVPAMVALGYIEDQDGVIDAFVKGLLTQNEAEWIEQGLQKWQVPSLYEVTA